MYSSSSGNFSTSSPTTTLSASSSERREQNSSSPLVRGERTTTSAVPRPSFLSSPVTTPSAYLTLGGVGSGASASISASSYLPSILDNDNIEQTFIDISAVPVSSSSTVASQHRQSGFVPPVIDPPPREPNYAREQTHPRDLSVHREASSAQGANRDRAPVRLDATIVGSRDHRGGVERIEYNNNNNNVANRTNDDNDNVQRKNTGKNLREAPNLSRGVPPANNDNMVATNATIGIQGQLGNWNIPVTLGGGSGGNNNNNSGGHQLPHHPHTLAGQQHHLSQMMASSTVSPPKQQGGPRRHTGPRPPKNETNLSPEESERRRVRRERNKLAAAKCRKRRMDHTAQLQEETEELESVQREIHNEILSLQQQKEQLEFILQAHKVHCKRGIPFTALPAVYVPPLTLPASSGGGAEDGGLKEELSGNLSNDSHSSTTSNYSPAPVAHQMQMTTAMAGAGVRLTNNINNNGGGGNPSLSAAVGVAGGTKNGVLEAVGVASTTAPTAAAAAHRPTSLPIIVKQEPPFLKVDSQLPRPQLEGDDVKPEAMDVSVTQATGISISTPKVSPRVLSFFDVIGDHTGLTPITGGGVISSVGSASGTPIAASGAAGSGAGGFLAATPPTTKMGTPTDSSNNGAEKPNSGQQHTLMSL